MRLLITILLLLSLTNLHSQINITLENPSFEGNRGPGIVPEGWVDCGFPSETPPDILPHRAFGVEQAPYDGRSYIGLMVKDNDTFESIGQELEIPMEKDSSYKFGALLSMSDTYVGLSRITHTKMNCTLPSVLRVWAGNDACDKQQLLGETDAIFHYDWNLYTFQFTVEDDWSWLILEAFYDETKSTPYCGHILIDSCSQIVKMKRLNINTDPEHWTAPNVKQYIKTCFANGTQRDPNGNFLTKMALLNNIFSFENAVKKIGVRQFVLASSFQNISVAIRCLEEIEAQQTAEAIKLLTKTHLKNKNGDPLTSEEVSYFENAEALIKKQMEADNFEEKINLYIVRHKQQLSDELSHCF